MRPLSTVRTRRSGSLRPFIAAGAVLSLLPLGVTAAPAPAAPDDAQSAATVSWGTCPQGWGTPHDQIDPADPMYQVDFSCATTKVPMDHDNPGGPTVSLAMRRIGATDPAHRIGTLFVNPGGPGGSGVDFTDYAWALYSPQVRARFDIVGFDPRGIARSDGLACFSSFQQANGLLASIEDFPVNRRQDRQIRRTNATIAKLCRRNGGPIASHLSTADVARDLESLRRAVGDEKLNYAGYSYGTQIGSTYAAMYPGNVRAMVLDGVLDPVAWTTGRRGQGRTVPSTTRLGSDLGSQDTLNQFFSLCRQSGAGACPLVRQGDPATIYRKVAALAEKDPIRLDLGGGNIAELTYQRLIGLTSEAMYNATEWTELAAVVATAADQTHIATSPARSHVSSTTKRRFSGAPMPSLGEGAQAVICEDADNPRDPEVWWRTARRRDRSTYFGSSWAYTSQMCSSWRIRDTDRYPGPFRTTTANPALVVGNLHDPATPYSGAEAVTANLAGSRLLTLAGWGHTSLGLSGCADSHVSAYLVTNALPGAGTTCRPDHLPFETDQHIVSGQATSTARATVAARLKARRYVSDLVHGR